MSRIRFTKGVHFAGGSACSVVAGLALAAAGVAAQEGAPRPRARDLGVRPGVFEPGPLNAITDVPGVRVGQISLVEGDTVRTGVTVIVPHPGNVFQDKVAGAVYVGNAFGKLAGSTQVEELGTIETPIVLTNTLAVGAAIEGIVSWTLAQPGNAAVRSVNALVGETNDGGLNDIRGLHVRPSHVRLAIDAARPGVVDEGSVGAGTGTRCFGWKCGIGTASRALPVELGGWMLGVIVQANFGGLLTMDGAPVGRELRRVDDVGSTRGPGADAAREAQDGSCMIVVATDAPIDARDLRRLAARAVFGLARTGASYANGSGDYAISFSTAGAARTSHGSNAPVERRVLPAEAMSPLFQAALEATEEAVYNALLRSTTVRGNGRTVEAISIDGVRDVLARHGHSPSR